MTSDSNTQKILTLLKKEYPRAKYYLNFSNPLQLLVSTILSAQARDEAVNALTARLFSKYKTAEDFANASLPELQKEISSITFFRNKAKNIKSAGKIISEKFNGKVPQTIEELTALPGIGRKTANVILINAFNIVEGIPVDTHVIRLACRLGLTKSKEPEKIEKDLMEIYPKSEWKEIPHLLKAHGRQVCKAPVPECSKCCLKEICPRQGVKKYK